MHFGCSFHIIITRTSSQFIYWFLSITFLLLASNFNYIKTFPDFLTIRTSRLHRQQHIVNIFSIPTTVCCFWTYRFSILLQDVLVLVASPSICRRMYRNLDEYLQFLQLSLTFISIWEVTVIRSLCNTSPLLNINNKNS